MRLSISILTILINFWVSSQTQHVGVNGGIHWANIKSDNFIGSKGGKTGSVFGVSYQTEFSNKLILGSELLYIQKGFKGFMSFLDSSGNPENVNSEFNYDYLSLPVKAGFSVGDKFAGYLILGISPCFLLKAQTITSAHYNSSGEIYEVRDLMKKMDFSALFEIGTTYSFTKKISAFTSISYQRSFISITSENYFFQSKIRHVGASLKFGLWYKI